MRRMRFARHVSFRGYDDDVEIIVTVLAARDVEIDSADAFLAWEAASESMCAGWLMLPTLSDEMAATRDEDDLLRMPEEDGGAIYDAAAIHRDVMRFLEEVPARDGL